MTAVYIAPSTDKTIAGDAVRFERLIELAMEVHRFYDLVRRGIADVVVNDFIKRESVIRTSISGVVFKKGEDEYMPIPEFTINQSPTSDGKRGLKQNTGY